MVPATKPFLELTAADLMSRDVVTIPWQMSLRAAAHELAQAHVSGAPVTDEQGRCVGVLSATDLVRWLERGEQASRHHFHASLCFCSDWGVLDIDVLPPDAVSRYMTADVVTATPETPVGQLARRMLGAHIHRIVVTDGRGRPIGIVSTTDILAAVAGEDLRWAEQRAAGA